MLDKAWKELGLDNMLEAEGFRDSRISAAKVSVFNRLDDPCSEHALAGWAETVALDELLGENVSRPERQEAGVRETDGDGERTARALPQPRAAGRRRTPC